MRVYIASHCRWAALHVASVLDKSTHVEFTSRWHYKEFKPTSEHSEDERFAIAKEDYDDVISCDVLVLIAGPHLYTGGKFVELGIALGAGKRVLVIGRRENMLVWHPEITRVDTPEQAEAELWK